MEVRRGGPVALLYQRRSEAPSRSQADVQSYGEELTALARRTDLLPMRFGSTVTSDSDVDDLLARRGADWADRLRETAGHVEVIVHAAQSFATSPGAAQDDAQNGSGQPGRRYLQRRAAAMAHEAARLEELTAVVRPCCRAVKALPATSEVRLACLVPASTPHILEKPLRRWADADHGREVRVTGPFPPLSFAEGDDR